MLNSREGNNMEIIKNKKDIKRIKTYINGLDENMEGGVPEGHIVLVDGSSGTMKSSISFNTLYNEAVKGNTGCYMTLEQSSHSIIKHMVNLDFDISKINLVIISDISKIDTELKSAKAKKGSLIMVDLSSIRKKVKDTKFSSGSDWLNAIKNIATKIAKDAQCKLFVLDSMSALYALSRFEQPRAKIFFIFEFLREIGLTSYLISESTSGKGKYTEFGVEEYLADGILHLELAERYRKVTRDIQIVKMRATNCNLDIFTLVYKNNKFSALEGGKTPVL
jgi:KaiC/GvpD/RAD55 family RecA-like ATPase